MAADLPQQAWFAILEFHDDAFSRENVIINRENIPGCILDPKSLARVTTLKNNVATNDFQPAADKHQNADSDTATETRTRSGTNEDEDPRRAVSRSTKRTSRSNRSLENQFHHSIDPAKSLVFVVNDASPEQLAKRPTLQISLHMSVRNVFGFTNRQQIVVLPADEYLSTASFVELAFRDQYLARADMWQLMVSELSRKAVVRGQELCFMGSIRARVKSIFVRGRKVMSAFVAPSTVPIFRSESAKYVFFIQMSREMWDYDAEGTGEIMFNKVINGFLPDLFKRWQRLGVRHLVSIILFARLGYEKGVLKQVDREGPNYLHRESDNEDKDYRDYYKVVTTDMTSRDWVRILYELRTEFKVFLRDVLILPGKEAYGRRPDSLAEVKDAPEVEHVIAGRPTIAAKGNVLEAIELASSQFAQDYIDRDLIRTGISLVIVTAGTGVFEVDYNMLKLTTDTLVGNGIGIDLVSLAPMPLHSVPLFRYRTPRFSGSRGKANTGSDNTPRNTTIYSTSTSPPKQLPQSALKSGVSFTSTHRSSHNDAEWSYALPHWIDVSFWTSDASSATDRNKAAFLAKRQRLKATFTPSCRMYELSMMGLMENEMTDIQIPFLRVRRDLLRPKSLEQANEPLHQFHGESQSSLAPRLIRDRQDLLPHAVSVSPKKSMIDEQGDDAASRNVLNKWMDQYDQDIFGGTRWEVVSKTYFYSSGEVILDTSAQQAFSANATVPQTSQATISPEERRVATATAAHINAEASKKEQSSSSVADTDDLLAGNQRSKTAKAQTPSIRSSKEPKRAKMPRQISMGPMGLGLFKGTASTSLSSATVEMSIPTETKKSPATPLRMSGLLTQQLRNSLNKKPSQQSMVATASDKEDAFSAKDVGPSNPISIVKDSSTDSSSEDDHIQSATIKPNTVLKMRDVGLGRAKISNPQDMGSYTSTSLKNRFGVQGGLSPLKAMSPWLTLLNPSNPKKENMSIASQYRRWQHVFPRAIPTSAIKWKSLCSPAALPLTSEYFPCPEDLKDQYDESPYMVSLADEEEMSEVPQTREALLRQLIASRLSNGFQIVIGRDAESFSKANGSTLIGCFEPQLEIEEGNTVLMSIGNNFHQLLCSAGDHIEVKRFIRKPVQLVESEGLIDPSVVYHPRVRTILAERYQMRRFIFRNPRSKYEWSAIDEFLSSRDREMRTDLGFWRARFVLIPVDPPKSSRGPLAPVSEVSDEEIRLEGIQRLTQVWQRHRYVPPEERRFQASVQQRRKDPNPLAIDYQTRDPSAVVRAYAGKHVEALLQGDLEQPLFAEAELYHTNDFDLQKLAQHVQAEPPKGVHVVDRRWHWKLYYKCFRGDEFTTWLLTNFKDMDAREDAVKLGNELMKKGLFTHVQQKHYFRDGNYFYQIASEYRSTPYPDTRATWFSKIADRSVPSTPNLEGPKQSPWSERSRSKQNNDVDDMSVSSGTKTPTRGKKTLELSHVLQYDVDHRKRSWRPEIINLHYDRIHNPDNCYHIRIEWMNVTSKLIEDAVASWSSSVERYGLKLVTVPIAEACTITSQHPFREPYRVDLAMPPPTTKQRLNFDAGSFIPTVQTEPLAYHKALLRKWDFVLDFEAASSFDSEVQVTYSWGKPDYSHLQFVHKSGLLIAEIDDDGSFILLANRLEINRTSTLSSKDSKHERERERERERDPRSSPAIRPLDTPPTSRLGRAAQPPPRTPHRTQTFTDSRLGDTPPTAESIKDAFETFCTSLPDLEAFYEEALKPSASPSPRHGPVTIGLSPRTTPTLKAHRDVLKGLESEIPALGLPEGRLGRNIGEGMGQRAVSYAPGMGAGGSGGGSGGALEVAGGGKGKFDESRRASAQGGLERWEGGA